VQPTGGVDQQQVGAFGPGLGEGIVASPAASAPLSRGDHARARALAPDLQLLDGGGAEGVAGGEDDLLALVAVELGELADGRVLPLP